MLTKKRRAPTMKGCENNKAGKMKIKEFRELSKKTRNQAAKELGVSIPTLWRWETKNTPPEPDSLRKIAEWSRGAVTANDFFM